MTSPTDHTPQAEYDAPRFVDWDSRHRAASRLVDEAYGWARMIDTSNDEAVLSWAREYLPRIVAHGETEVIPPASEGR